MMKILFLVCVLLLNMNFLQAVPEQGNKSIISQYFNLVWQKKHARTAILGSAAATSASLLFTSMYYLVKNKEEVLKNPLYKEYLYMEKRPFGNKEYIGWRDHNGKWMSGPVLRQYLKDLGFVCVMSGMFATSALATIGFTGATIFNARF